MAHSHETRIYVFEKTDGRCHICRTILVFDNYGLAHLPGGWEIDHSHPKARGGTDRRQNLQPACPPCNRSKQAGSTRSARAQYGYSKAPMSRQKQDKARAENTLIGGGAGAAVGGLVGGPVGLVIGAVVGGLLGDDADVE